MKRKLTEIGVERMSPPEKGRLDIWDTVITGLTLRVTGNGVKTWCFVYRNAEGQNRLTFGRFPAISVLKAREIAKKAQEDIALGHDPIALREERERQWMERIRDEVTVQKLSEDFIELYAKPKNRKWKATQQVFKNHINPFMGDMVAKNVQRKDVHRLLDKLKASKRPHAANHTLIALRKMYNWAIERDELQFNPCHMISRPAPVQERERFLTRAEIKALWGVCDKIGYPYGPIVKLLLLTGQRRSEISNLEWRFINLEEKVIRLPAASVKAKRTHEIPLSDMAIDILKSLPRFTGPYVFTSTHGRTATNGFGKSKKETFEPLFKAENWRFHDLRRTAATGMAQIGIPTVTISRILNHAEGGVTKIYARYSYLKEKRQALDTWAQHVQGILTSQDEAASNVVQLERAG